MPTGVNLDANNDGVVDGPYSSQGVATTVISGTAVGITPENTDGDGVPDMLDLDSDNDALSDLAESGQPGVVDANNDGVADAPDTDKDGIVDSADGNDTPGTFGDQADALPRNTDAATDAIPDFRDLDSDNDGIKDIVEAGRGGLDGDGDGKVGSPTSPFTDPDGDGIANNGNLDSKPNAFGGLASPDTDKDGIPDAIDTDDDNDGILDVVEGVVDTDGDGVPNNQDLDSDNDGINDVREANGTDNNNDGIDDGIPNTLGEPVPAGLTPPNTDGDTVPDFLDLDTDNDGLSDLVEGGSGGTDTDNDGVADGPDSDGDGIVDSVDDKGTFGDQSDPLPRNTDAPADTRPDYRDIDSNNDGTNDILTVGLGGLDTNNDGRIDSPLDPDGDGIANNLIPGTTIPVDSKTGTFGGLGTALYAANCVDADVAHPG